MRFFFVCYFEIASFFLHRAAIENFFYFGGRRGMESAKDDDVDDGARMTVINY